MLQIVRERPSAPDVENLFGAITSALRIAIKLDEVKMTSDGSGCLIRSHDAYGRLPEVKISFLQDKESTLDCICISTARLGMAVQFRQDLANSLCGCRFFLPASKKKSTLVGIRAGGKTIIAKGPDPCQAYQELKKAADMSLKTA
jgi:hypothetical protein